VLFLFLHNRVYRVEILSCKQKFHNYSFDTQYTSCLIDIKFLLCLFFHRANGSNLCKYAQQTKINKEYNSHLSLKKWNRQSMKLILNKFILWLLLSSYSIATQAANLDEQLSRLTTQKNYVCMNCHRAEELLVGPSYRQISEKYNKLIAASKLTRAAVETKLAQAIVKGQIGQWGEVIAMPPNQVRGVTFQEGKMKLDQDGDLKMLLDWILSLASH